MSGLEWVGIALSLAKTVDSLAEFLITGYSDTSKFGPDLEKVRLALSIEASNFRSLKTVLFGRQDEVPVAPPRTVRFSFHARVQQSTSSSPPIGLFRDLDPQTQLDVINVLRQFRESLEAQYQLVRGRYGSSQPNLRDVVDSSVSFGSYHTASLLRRVRWGFAEKAKVEKALRELQCWNERLHRMVQIKLIQNEIDSPAKTEIASPPSTLFQKMQSTGLTGDMDSLGLIDDIQLAKISTGSSALPSPSLRLGQDMIERYEQADVLVRSASRRLVVVDGQHVLLEYKDYDEDQEGSPSEAAQNRIGNLATMLQKIKSSRYHALQCDKYYWRKGQFVLSFPIPATLAPGYTTLISILQQSRVPSLEDRFILARTLCAAVAQLHTVGWIHKSIRSDNILFFTPNDSSSSGNIQTPSSSSAFFEQLYLSGWEYSRPETGFSSKPIFSNEIAENVYRHPEQWGLPTVRFGRVHDIYSLGVVLLEIGRWKPALGFHHGKFRNVESGSLVRNRLVESATDQKMLSSMGTRYQSIVLKCLQWSSLQDVSEDVETLDFQTEVLDTLDEIVSHL
ncbi:hypothetical protein B0H66DRAFT_344444 [Apodospora peruviana]|uniref:Protein kinase domain-containing protein n=1 Tax=Apodospora peruviana TaxID=516989 RepID=A0AAE0HYW2_9PEZI|nr:hypothetical protein B0H66DRAFT_344444 [Apodospora peruviana]